MHGERSVVSSAEKDQGDASERGLGFDREDSAMSRGRDAKDGNEESEGTGEIGRVEGRSGRFDWALGRVRGGKGAKKRKGLVDVIVKEWDKCHASGIHSLGWRYFAVGDLSSLLTVKTLTGMTTDVYPRENCIAPAIVLIVWTTNTKNRCAREG